MQKLVGILIGVMLSGSMMSGCVAHQADSSRTARLRFVPVDAHEVCGGGASWCALHPSPADPPGVLMAMARAGIGDTFPVKEENGPTLFDVVVVAGDDDHILLEIRAREGSQRIDLRRDNSESVQVSGNKYGLSYPSVHVAPDQETTTNKAMLLVHRFP